MQIREALLGDLPALVAIYNDAVITSVATFDREPVSVEERQAWLEGFGGEHPLLVCTESDVVLGYAYYTRFHGRPGYARTKECSVYVNRAARGRGVATRLYEALIDHARASGVHVLVGVLGGDNPASAALHRKLGFEQAGHLREVGHKLGGWVDTYYYQKIL